MNVELNEHDVVIKSLEISDVRVVAEFNSALERGIEPEEFCLTLLKLGAEVVSLSSNSASAEKLDASVAQAKASIKEAAEGFELAIRKQMSDFSAEDGLLQLGLVKIVENLKVQIDELTAGEDSPLRTSMLKSLNDAQVKIRNDIQSQVEGQKKEIASLLDPVNPTSPLRSLVQKIDSLGLAVAQVQEKITEDVAIAEIVETGVVGGFEYEEEAFRFVQRIASVAGDDCEHTGNFTGRVSKSKKGDGVVHLNVGGTVAARIVLEAKNKELRLAEWEKECEAAKENRAATAFLGLCKHLEDMPNGNRFLVLDTQSIVLAFNPEIDDPQILFLVYQMIKLNALSRVGRLGASNTLEVKRNLDEAMKSLEKFDGITKQVSAIRNSADSIAKDADLIRNAISDQLAAAQSSILTGIALDSLEAEGVSELDQADRS
jgi:hypothetical protein